MAKIELKLFNQETEKTEVYTPKKPIWGRVVRELLKKQAELEAEDASPLEQIDGMVEFFAENVFDKQFTLDDFYDGIESDQMFKTISELSEKVTGMKNGAMINDPKIVK